MSWDIDAVSRNLTPEQRKAVRKYWVDFLLQEIVSDKPFGTDEHPRSLSRLLSTKEELEWEEVVSLFNEVILKEPDK